MQRHLYCTQKPCSVQSQFVAILRKVQQEWKAVAPFLKRKNHHLLQQSDAHILTLHLLGKGLGFTSERAWHRFIQGNLGTVVERSRYNRRCRDLRFALKWLRKRLSSPEFGGPYSIVDSLPLPLCHPVRLARARSFRGLADVGYCASKRSHYYGFKLHVQIDSFGFVQRYVLSAASVHDVQIVEELLCQAPSAFVLGDKGYLSHAVQVRLKQHLGTLLCVPTRSNSKEQRWTPAFTRWMRRKRKQIETVFSILVTRFALSSIRSKSPAGFETNVDGILLAYTLWKLGVIPD
ncbi:IS982 family transposase [Paenibacillus sp. WLX2291]|uniref:IS982 family transposase n=1 Tax=Paenibacillus sp. WLX2291 TaxID=3296934 RepID=UPI003983FCE0